MTELLADRKEQNVVLGFHPSNILRILTPLVFAPCNRAETLAMTVFSGGGAPNSKPHKAFRHIAKSCHSQNPSSRNTSQKLVNKSIVLLKPT